MEYLDIVNDSDEVIGKALRSDAHIKKLLHRISLIFCFEDESMAQVLIQKRSDCCEIAPLKLSVPGGHVGLSEDYKTAAIREFLEEENGKSELFEWFKFKSFTDGSPKFTTVFKTYNKGPFTNQKEEVEKSFFINMSELRKEILKNPDEYTEIMAECFKHI